LMAWQWLYKGQQEPPRHSLLFDVRLSSQVLSKSLNLLECLFTRITGVVWPSLSHTLKQLKINSQLLSIPAVVILGFFVRPHKRTVT